MEISNISNTNIESNINTDSNKIHTKEISNITKNDKTKPSKAQKNDNTGYDEKIDKLIKDINKKGKVVNKEFSYKIHEKTNRYIVSVKESDTGKVLKEIPSEESLDLYAKILETAGLLIDKKS